LACARAFLQEGARVTLVARDSNTLQAAQQSLQHAFSSAQLRTHSADLRDAHAAATMLERAQALDGPVDVLVNCAGAAQRTPPGELTPQSWQDAMQAKYFSYLNVIDPVIKAMAARGRGSIVNVVGMGGKVASPIHLPGGAANAALMLASAGLANAFARHGVRVNVVNPGLTLTERLQEGLGAQARLQQISVAQALQREQERLPMGRIADPAEIANAVVFLASSKASYINGATLAMDGALTPLV
jgi:NAD(P)-dependent dehydrogenase (short-subunit alcohol dehydrogenase family)